VASRDACVHAGDSAVGHELSFFECLLDTLYRSVDIDNSPALEPVARCNTQACKLKQAALLDFGHHHHDFGGADVEAHNDVFVFFSHDVVFS